MRTPQTKRYGDCEVWRLDGAFTERDDVDNIAESEGVYVVGDTINGYYRAVGI